MKGIKGAQKYHEGRATSTINSDFYTTQEDDELESIPFYIPVEVHSCFSHCMKPDSQPCALCELVFACHQASCSKKGKEGRSANNNDSLFYMLHKLRDSGEPIDIDYLPCYGYCVSPDSDQCSRCELTSACWQFSWEGLT